MILNPRIYFQGSDEPLQAGINRSKAKGSSGKATANKKQCPSCKGSLGKLGVCMNRRCDLFGGIMRPIMESR